MKKFFKYLFVFLLVFNVAIFANIAFSYATDNNSTNEYYSTLQSDVNALSSSSTLRQITAVDEKITQAVSINLITEAQFDTLNSTIISLLYDKRDATYTNGQTINATTISSDTVWVLNGTITQSGKITVDSNNYVFVMLTTEGATIERGITNSSLIHFNETNQTVDGVTVKQNVSTLLLKGKNANTRFVYDGGAEWATDDDSSNDEIEACLGRGLKNTGIVGNDIVIYMPGTLRMSYVSFQNNDITGAMAPGGAIRMRGSSGQNYLYNINFINSTHPAGGNGFSVQGDAADHVDDFITNTLMDGRTVTGIIANKITGYGNYSSSSTGMGGSVISSGGVYTTASLYLYNSNFRNNWSNTYGGAIKWTPAEGIPTLNIEGCTFDNNAAYTEGGAIACFSAFTITNSTVSNNKVINGGGGGIYLTTPRANGTVTSVLGEGTIINNNQALWLGEDSGVSETVATGGGVHVDINSVTEEDGTPIVTTMIYNLYYRGAQIYQNEAIDAGGGYDVRSTNTALSLGYQVNVVMESGNIFENEAAWGGGMYLGNTPIVFPENSAVVVEGNVAKGGAGIFSEYSSSNVSGTMTFNGGIVRNNIANQSGGGIHVKSTNNTLTLNIGGNFEVYENYANGSGAGIAAGGGTVNITGSDIHDNTAEINGGGIYITSAVVNISGGNVHDNESQDGGGIYVYKGELKITGGIIECNKCTQDGGGFYVNDSAVEIDGGIISENQALRDGGGFILYQEGTVSSLVVTGGEISNNTSTRNGAGIYIHAGEFNLEGGNIFANTAESFGGGIYQNSGDATILAGLTKIERNTAANGGGIYLNSGSLDVQGGIIYSNKAVGTPDASITSAKDSTVGVGGGVYILEGTFSMKNGIGKVGIYDNTAVYAADDIFASGNNTTFDAITITQMLLRADYKLSDSWFEDYPEGESHIALDGSGNTITSVGRCHDLMRQKRNDALVEATIITDTCNEYICATLGLGVGTLSMTVDGMNVANADTFIFLLESVDIGSADAISMRIVVSKDLPLTVLRLPIGSYKITFLPEWSWRYGSINLNNSLITTSYSFSLRSGNIEELISTFTKTNSNWLSHSFVTPKVCAQEGGA